MRKGIKQRLNLLGDHPFSSFSSANPMPGAPVEPLSEVRGALVSKALRTDPRFSCLRCSLMPGCRLTCRGFPGRRCSSPELGPGRCVLHRGCVLAEAGLGGNPGQTPTPRAAPTSAVGTCLCAGLRTRGGDCSSMWDGTRADVAPAEA